MALHRIPSPFVAQAQSYPQDENLYITRARRRRRGCQRFQRRVHARAKPRRRLH